MEQDRGFSVMWLIVPILLVIHVIVCVLLVLVVLMQLPRSEGLGAAFGGAVTENIFGAQTTHVLSKFTVWLGAAFFAITLLLAIAYSHRASGQTKVQQELLKTAPASSPAPAATPAASPQQPAPAPTAASAASPEAATSSATALPAPSPEAAISSPSPAATAVP